MKLAIVIGHNSQRQGAVRADTGETEYAFNSRLANQLEILAQSIDGTDLRVFRRQPGMGYSREIRAVYDEVDLWGADASIELHFNSVEAATARGTETLSSGTDASLRLANAVHREIVASLSLRDRGIKTLAQGERGFKSLIAGRAPAILIEPFFGSNAGDAAAIDEADELRSLASAILRGAQAAYGVLPRQDIAESRTMAAAGRKRRKEAWAVGTAVCGAAAQVALGEAQTVTEAVEQGNDLAQYLPWLAPLAPAVVVGLLVWSRLDLNDIEEARIDDFERGAR